MGTVCLVCLSVVLAIVIKKKAKRGSYSITANYTNLSCKHYTGDRCFQESHHLRSAISTDNPIPQVTPNEAYSVTVRTNQAYEARINKEQNKNQLHLYDEIDPAPVVSNNEPVYAEIIAERSSKL